MPAVTSMARDFNKCTARLKTPGHTGGQHCARQHKATTSSNNGAKAISTISPNFDFSTFSLRCLLATASASAALLLLLSSCQENAGRVQVSKTKQGERHNLSIKRTRKEASTSWLVSAGTHKTARHSRRISNQSWQRRWYYMGDAAFQSDRATCLL